MKIEHVAMYVNDLEECREFFVKYFGAKANLLYNNPTKKFRSYFLTFDGEARLEIMNKADMSDDKKSIARTGFIHVAFSVGSKEKVNKLTAQ